MHPAPSVIIFSTLSGAGFGFLAFLGLGAAAQGTWQAVLQFGLAFGLAIVGLVASSFHLGRPERALLAFTQWRSSWLSREAWLSVATLIVMGVFAAALVFFGRELIPVGFVGAGLALATIVATAMIYAQLRTVPRWNSAMTPANFGVAALSGGAILAGQAILAVLLLAVLTLVQIAAWVTGDRRFARRGHDMQSATGLTHLKDIRQFESPHTGDNYLLREFVHEVGRRHSRKLRWIAILAMGPTPALLLVAFPAAPFEIAMTFCIHIAGVFASRWLFFAEAEHVVRLYYGVT
jgi:sulfite dehydrogenase (quinone) subunit SoeC